MCDQPSGRRDIKDPQAELTKFKKQNSALQTARSYDHLHKPVKAPCSDQFTGYGVHTRKQNPMYTTSNSAYGYYPPNVYTIPTRLHSLSQEFTNFQHRCGSAAPLHGWMNDAPAGSNV